MELVKEMFTISGSISKDKNTGKWFFILELGKDVNGKRKQKKRRGFKTKKEAQAAFIELQNEVNNGTYIEPSKLLVKDFLYEWFKLKKTTISHQTCQVYDRILEIHIIPSLGTMKLIDLKTIHIQSYINTLHEKGYAPETIKKFFNIIRNALAHALDMELISSNSANKVKLPSISRKTNMAIWDKDQVNQFLNVAKGNRYFIMYHLALMTGMRQGEILGLRWKDIDFTQNVIRISQTLSHDGKRFLEGAKSKASIRTIALPETTIKVLCEHKEIIAMEKEDFGEGYCDYDLVVCTPIGSQLIPSNIRKAFNRLIEKAEVPKIRFHDMRHTHATLLLAQGINVKVISERLGHSNIKITLDTYSHILPSMQQEVAQKLNDLFT